MTAQKFHKGDLVHVAKDLGPSMSHFRADCRAIVVGSYADQYGKESTTYVDQDGNRTEVMNGPISYTLWLEGGGKVSWYHEDQLEILEHDRWSLTEEWERELDARPPEEQVWSRAVPVTKGDARMKLPLEADQRSTIETFCWELMGRVSVTLYEAMLKAAEYVVHGLNGVDLCAQETGENKWGQPYHDLMAVFRPEHTELLVPVVDDEDVPWQYCWLLRLPPSMGGEA